MKFRLTTTVEYKDDDLKALRHLAKEFECTPKEWLEIHVLREGETSAKEQIWDAVQYLFEQEEYDE
jgi:hypothetical protein|tara:strand:- start:405 stop:602 length:198 start_codon:yes stop_codon:yes gene_type:complete